MKIYWVKQISNPKAFGSCGSGEIIKVRYDVSIFTKIIVKIMRNKSFQNENSFVIMTTHSESLLNFTLPEEIIIVSMNKGVTVARRIKNMKSLKNEISKTGFGLGFFYFSGGIE